MIRGCFLIFLFVTVLAIILGFLVLPDVGKGRKGKLFSENPAEKELVKPNN